MNSDISTSCKCFGLYEGDNIIGFMGVLHQPHGKHKNLKRCSRIVILPDYQGIGLGCKFLNAVAEYYFSMGYDFSIVTTAKNFIYKLNKSPEWRLIRLSVSRCSSNKSAIDYQRKSLRNSCKTASFMYRGKKS
ncbi:MAG: GNAT family N-acetyltransferase [Ruminococcus sp.]|nr:GNAT family N-acetyltransferase [Ruminococcus sp.]